jgi:hypothetical protein
MTKAWAGACLLVIGVLVAAFALVCFFIGVLFHDYVPLGIIIAAATMAVGGVVLCIAGWWVSHGK